MDLNKRKHLTSEKIRELPVEFFLFVCLSFQTRKDLALFKFGDAAVRRFLKSLRKYALKRLWRRPFQVIVLKNGLSHGHLSISFQNTF